MQTLTAIRESVEETEEDFDDFYGTYADYKAAEARFAQRIREANEAYKNGTLKTYTEEECEKIFAEWDKEFDAIYAANQRKQCGR